MAQCFLYDNCNRKDCDKDFCLRRYKLEYLYNNALVSESQRKHIKLMIDENGTDYNEFTELANIEKNIDSFIQNGQNLYIHSTNCGNGKSSWALRMIESYFNKIWPKTDLICRALFINVPRFLIALKDNISNPSEYINHIKDNIATADLVVWDDIASKVGSEFELNHLLSLIDLRIANGKSNIYTSNLSKEAIYEALGERLASRICNMSHEIELHGSDKRFLKVN